MNWWGIFWQQLARMCKNQGAMTRGLGTAEPSQPLKLAPPKHDERSSATYELPQKIFACWRFRHSRAGAAISRTLALSDNPAITPENGWYSI